MAAPLAGQVALVAGAHARRGPRASPCELRRGRRDRLRHRTHDPARSDREMNRPETIEETAELVDAAGGRGIAVQRRSHCVPDRGARRWSRASTGEQTAGSHVLVNDIWGATTMEWNKSEVPRRSPGRRETGRRDRISLTREEERLDPADHRDRRGPAARCSDLAGRPDRAARVRVRHHALHEGDAAGEGRLRGADAPGHVEPRRDPDRERKLVRRVVKCTVILARREDWRTMNGSTGRTGPGRISRRARPSRRIAPSGFPARDRVCRRGVRSRPRGCAFAAGVRATARPSQP